jgi:hypothetical protein
MLAVDGALVLMVPIFDGDADTPTLRDVPTATDLDGAFWAAGADGDRALRSGLDADTCCLNLLSIDPTEMMRVGETFPLPNFLLRVGVVCSSLVASIIDSKRDVYEFLLIICAFRISKLVMNGF